MKIQKIMRGIKSAALLFALALVSCEQLTDTPNPGDVPGATPEEESGSPAAPVTFIASTLAELQAWLEAQPENTVGTPYYISLTGIDLMDLASGTGYYSDGLGALGSALNGKYVALDLSGCTGTTFGATDGALSRTTAYRNKLVSVVLPNTPTSIAAYTFTACTNLKQINLPPGITSIGSCFQGAPLTFERWDERLTNVSYLAFGGGKLLSYDNLTSAFISNADFMIIRDMILPMNITSIAVRAYMNRQDFTMVNVPARVITIGEYAFYACYELRYLYLPEGLTAIDRFAFQNCRVLTSITLPANLHQYWESGIQEFVH